LAFSAVEWRLDRFMSEDVAMADASAHGPLDPSSGGRQAALAARWRRLRDGVPSTLYLLGWALVLLVVLVALGWLLAKVVHDDGIGRADSGLSRWLAGERTPDLNTLTRWTTWLSETITVTVLAVVTVAITALVWRQWREPMLVAVAVAGEVAIFLAITLLVDRRRPPVSHLDQAPPTSSFPSGHTAAAICLYGALAVLASQRARSALVRGLTLTLAVLIPLAVATARVYRGMHYLTDVVGGILLGGAWLLATVHGIRLGAAHWQLRHRTASRK
jgi:membrane-associated phospholipid phosphatase